MAGSGWGGRNTTTSASPGAATRSALARPRLSRLRTVVWAPRGCRLPIAAAEGRASLEEDVNTWLLPALGPGDHSGAAATWVGTWR